MSYSRHRRLFMDKKAGVMPREVADFCREASSLVNVPLNVEGKYRWIVFLPSKIHSELPVLNRYYGVFEDGRIKMRGIEARRSDTPPFIKNAQVEMIRVLSRASSYQDFVRRIPEALLVLRENAKKLLAGKVNIYDLLVSKRLSKHPKEYTHDVFQAVAARQLMYAGFDVYPGQTVQYLITDADNKNPNSRVRATKLLGSSPRLDVEKYLEMLLEASETLFTVFGYALKRIRSEVLYGERQLILN